MESRNKKKLYYVAPLIAVPLLLLLCELLDNAGILRMSPHILGVFLFLLSFVMGFFSQTHRTFDYLMTAIMPFSLVGLMFIGGFLDKSDLETRFHLYKAIKTVFQPIALQLYFLMAVTTFVASFKPIRNKVFTGKESC